MSANSSNVTPLQSLPWKNSILSLPKKPSARALSGLQPFLDIDLYLAIGKSTCQSVDFHREIRRRTRVMGTFPDG